MNRYDRRDLHNAEDLEKRRTVEQARIKHDVRADREGHKNMVWDALPELMREEFIYRETKNRNSP